MKKVYGIAMVLIASYFSCSVLQGGIELIGYLKRTDELSRFYSLIAQAKEGGKKGGANSVRDRLDKRINKHTVFVPNNIAFNFFGKIGFLKGKDTEDLFSLFIQSHVVPDKKIRQLRLKRRPPRMKSLAGTRIFTSYKDKKLYVSTRRRPKKEEKSEVLYSVETENGIVHVINKVLVVKKVKAKLEALEKVKIR